MPLRKREADEVRALCAQQHPDDGVNPRDDKKRDVDTREKHNRKTQQLCKQVANALELVLPNVQLPGDVRILSVTPAPNAGRLSVLVAVSGTSTPEQVASRLEECTGYLRAELAQVVSRRRVPELAFSIVTEGTNDA